MRGRHASGGPPGGEAPAPRASPTPPAPNTSVAATTLVALVTVALLLVSISNQIADPDLWQHVVVGRTIWELHRVPTEHLWTWPSLGRPDILPSWLYRVVVWPFWSLGGGVVGFYALKWVLAIAAFALVWVVARRLGTRGLSIFVLLAMCANIYRRRSERPEMLAVVFMLAMLWILEARRQGGKDRTWWLVPLQWGWTNAHISYFFGFAILAFHVLDDLWTRARGSARSGGGVARAPAATQRLVIVGVVALVASMINPFGWRALWQPFDFFLHNRDEPIFSTIGELMPVFWRHNWTNGLFLLVPGWPLLLWWRARRRGLDLAEVLLCVFFTPIMLSSQRFMAFYALVAAPFVARALAEWLAQLRPRPWPIARRAALAAGLCVLVWLPEWLVLIRGTLGTRYDLTTFPVAASDFVAAHDIRGRAFNPFHWGGYLLYRFYPDRERLPFIDIHQTGTREDRLLYMDAHVDSARWQMFDRKHRFEWVLMNRPLPRRGVLLDVLDRDPRWALVFLDDVSALYLRKEGRLAEKARALEYHKLVAGTQGLEALRQECRSDSVACAAIEAELERAAAASRQNADSRSLLANLALLRGDYSRARAELERALATNPVTPRAHYRLAVIALEENRPADAVREFLAQRRVDLDPPGMSLLLGKAYRRAGDPKRAAYAYRWALRKDPASAEARDSLLALARSGAL